MADDRRLAEVLQNTRIHQESAEHALRVKDVEHWCLAALVNVDVPRILAAARAALEFHQPADRGRVMPCCAGCESGDTASPAGCHEWPCPEYEAIRAALLGEEGGDE